MCNEFTTFSFSENVEKTMPKGSPKVMVLDPLGIKGSIYRVFWLDLGRCRSGGQKINKIDPSGTKGRKGTKDPSPRGGLRRRTRPQGPRERGGGGKSLPRVGEEGLKAECS